MAEERIKIKYWYSSDGTPNIDPKSCEKLRNYVGPNLINVKKDTINLLSKMYKVFKAEGKGITCGKLEIRIDDLHKPEKGRIYFT